VERIKISKNNFGGSVSRAVEVLVSGGVVVVPTDTVYGLAADVGNEKAVQKVFEIKGRSEDKKLPVFVSSFEMLGQSPALTTEPSSDRESERVLYFLRKVLPGKITCVLRAKGGRTIAVRMPNYDLVLKIIEKFGRPITGTSANVAGKPEHTKIDELIAEFKNLKVKPDLILDAGDLSPSKPSTVLDCTIWPPKILREGAVSKKELKKLIFGDILK